MSSSSHPRPLPCCKLFDLVVDMDWKAVIEHAEQFPEDATWQDYHGDDGGETPLYLACQYRAPPRVIQAIISAYPEALCLENRNGNVPLHIACHCDASIEVINVLVEADPSTVFLGTKWGKTPLNALYDGLSKRAASTDVLLIDAEPWEKIELLLRTVALEENLRTASGDWLILHAAVSLGGLGCPEKVFDLTLEHYIHQISEKDPLGRLPLHIAAGPARGIRYGPNLKRTYKPRERHVFDSLLRHYPEAARVPDEQGRLPLHSAVSNGHVWEGGVELLFMAAPEAISVLDPVTGLFPFFLAAVPVRETAPSLTTIFNLLCSQPHVVTCCHPTRAETNIWGSPAMLAVQAFRQRCSKDSVSLSIAVSVAAFSAYLGYYIASIKGG